MNDSALAENNDSLPFVGIGARAGHYGDLLKQKLDKIDWLEFHTEDFLYPTKNREIITELAKIYPISLHGVGLSLGSACGISKSYLTRIKQLIAETEPFLISEHLSWSASGNHNVPDLLPLPYTSESLDICIRNIKFTQDFLERKILIENPSSYLQFKQSNIDEEEFLTKICDNAGCFILLDVNNIFVSAINHGFSAKEYIDKIPKKYVKEIHLAGHSQKPIDSRQEILIDTHSGPVCDEVWDLYSYSCKKFGKIPTLIEWDNDLPNLKTLTSEAKKTYNFYKKRSGEI